MLFRVSLSLMQRHLYANIWSTMVWNDDNEWLLVRSQLWCQENIVKRTRSEFMFLNELKEILGLQNNKTVWMRLSKWIRSTYGVKKQHGRRGNWYFTYLGFVFREPLPRARCGGIYTAYLNELSRRTCKNKSS